MNVEDITLQSLLDNPLIRKELVNGDLYFLKDTLNSLYDDNFKFVESTQVKFKNPIFWEMAEFISWPMISEHVEHRKNMPSFESRIDMIFGKSEKK